VLSEVSVIATQFANPLYQHGPLKVADDRRHLSHEDGIPFLWLADTWWYGFSKRTRWPVTFQELVIDRVKKGFSVIQVVVGVPPEISFWSKQARNEGGHPFL